MDPAWPRAATNCVGGRGRFSDCIMRSAKRDTMPRENCSTSSTPRGSTEPYSSRESKLTRSLEPPPPDDAPAWPSGPWCPRSASLPRRSAVEATPRRVDPVDRARPVPRRETGLPAGKRVIFAQYTYGRRGGAAVAPGAAKLGGVTRRIQSGAERAQVAALGPMRAR